MILHTLTNNVHVLLVQIFNYVYLQCYCKFIAVKYTVYSLYVSHNCLLVLYKYFVLILKYKIPNYKKYFNFFAIKTFSSGKINFPSGKLNFPSFIEKLWSINLFNTRLILSSTLSISLSMSLVINYSFLLFFGVTFFN